MTTAAKKSVAKSRPVAARQGSAPSPAREAAPAYDVEKLIHAHLVHIAQSSAGFARATHQQEAERNLEEVG